MLIRHLQESNLLPQILGLYQRTNALGLNVFIYGRGTENRTLIDRLKADYSTFELYPHMVPPLRIELSLLGLRVRYATVTSRRDGFVNIFFYVPSWTIRGSRMTLEFTRFSFHIVPLSFKNVLYNNLGLLSTFFDVCLLYLLKEKIPYSQAN